MVFAVDAAVIALIAAPGVIAVRAVCAAVTVFAALAVFDGAYRGKRCDADRRKGGADNDAARQIAQLDGVLSLGQLECEQKIRGLEQLDPLAVDIDPPSLVVRDAREHHAVALLGGDAALDVRIRKMRDIESASAEASHDRLKQRAVEIPKIIGVVLNVHRAVLGLERDSQLLSRAVHAERENAVRFAVKIRARALAVDIDRRFALIARREVRIDRAILARAREGEGQPRICILVGGGVFRVARRGIGRNGVRYGQAVAFCGRVERLPHLDRLILAEHGGEHGVHARERVIFVVRFAAENVLVDSEAERQRIRVFVARKIVLAVRRDAVVERRVAIVLADEIADGKERVKDGVSAVIARPVRGGADTELTELGNDAAIEQR